MPKNSFLSTHRPLHRLILAVVLIPAALPASSYEAESYANTLTGAASVTACTPCSGGLDVSYLGKGSSIQINGVDGGSSGPVQITVFYGNGSPLTLTATVTVNADVSASISLPPTGGWWVMKAVTVTASLGAGTGNTITIGNASGWVPEIDRIDVNSLAKQMNSTVAPANTVVLNSFGSAGQGGDDTAVIQLAINATAAQGQVLEIPASAQTYNVGPLALPTGANVLLDAGATVEANPGYGLQDRLLTMSGVDNVTITGTPGASFFRMRKTEYTSGEYRHCLAIYDSSNVHISGIACDDSGGDGLYISGGSNITVEDAVFDNNRRQGFSLISGNGIYVRRCSFTNTSGTLPQDGIGIEPNGPGEQLTEIHIEDSYSKGNFGNGVAIDTRNLDGSSAPVSITILRHQTDGNTLSGYYATNDRSNGYGVSGTILILQSWSMMDQQYGAVASFYSSSGAALIFKNLTVIDANQARTTYDNAAVAVKRGGGGVWPEGNVSFEGSTIIDTTGTLQCYFTLRDFSNIGFAAVYFLDPVQLSGLPSNLPVGLYNGDPVFTVNIP